LEPCNQVKTEPQPFAANAPLGGSCPQALPLPRRDVAASAVFPPGGYCVLAWCGWQLQIPLEWRPLRIDSGWVRGSMLVGTADAPLLQIKWWRPHRKRFKALAWIQSRIKSVAASGAVVNPLRAQGEGFQTLVSAVDNNPRRKRNRVLWYAHAPAANLIVELVANAAAAPDAIAQVTERIVPSLAASGLDAPTRWAVYDVSFESPPQFAVASIKMLAGDIALELFERKHKSRLVLRQIYPARLALARRDICQWLESSHFKEHRKFKLSAEIKPWHLQKDGRILEGILRRGHKRLPVPLGWCAPRRSAAAALNDAKLGRLLLAEYDAAAHVYNESVLETALLAMNWTHSQRAD
jgi:hypothetical protein